jgi:hypothetical protein
LRVERDIAEDSVGLKATPVGLETPFLKLSWSLGDGISSIIEKATATEWLDDTAEHSPFLPVYEVSPMVEPYDERFEVEVLEVRRRMGRNRKNSHVERFSGKLVQVSGLAVDAFSARATLKYKVEGLPYYSVKLVAYAQEARLDVSVELHKASVWAPENLYLSLPFLSPRRHDRLWLDKPGARVEPWKDQMPGTLTDFYAIQEGFAICGETSGLSVGTPDVQILQLGDLNFKPRILMGQPALQDETMRPYILLMSNYFEVNFEANLGGFYQFDFHLSFGAEFADPDKAIQACRRMSEELPVFRGSLKEGDAE